MDIDDFLDREVSDLGLSTGKAEPSSTAEQPKIKDTELSPLMENIRAQLLKGNIDLAEQSYVQLWNSLFQQKLKWNKELHEQLSMLSKMFQSAINQTFDSTKRKSDHISELISRGRASLNEGRRDIPFKIYATAEETVNSIPDAFFEQKRVIQEQVMAYYKDLRNSTDNELINRVANLVQEVNRLIDRINTAIGRNDMVNAILNYNKSVELYNQIPEGFLRHKNAAAIRLLQIYKSLSINNEITALQKEMAAGIPYPEAPHNLSSPQISLPKEINDKLNIFQKPASEDSSFKSRILLLKEKKERAKRNIEKGFYSEASRDIEEALKIEPKDAEAKAINAKIKTLE